MPEPSAFPAAVPTTGAVPAAGTPADTDRLADEIAELAAHIHAATYRLLELLAEFDRREGWGNGFRSCAHWLSWRTGIALGAAREKVRVARALTELPRISEAMRVGALSYSKVRALTRVATPASEADLLDFAAHGTTAHVERLVRAWRQVDRNEAADLDRARHEARSLTVYPDEDGSWVVRGRLDPEVGALLRKALDAAAAEAIGPEPPTHRQRMADAIGLLAERAMASDETTRRAERYQVVVHTGQLGVLGGGPDDIHVSAETFRRLSCDGTVVEMRHDEAGGILDVGRRARTVPPAMRRALEFRDGGCRFPGCAVRHTDAHHADRSVIQTEIVEPAIAYRDEIMKQRIREFGVRTLLVLVSTAFLATLSACDDDPTSPELLARYQVEVSGETFVVGVTTPDQVQQMETRLVSGEEGVLSGELAAGDAGYNDPWSWHMIPSTVETPDVSIEVCDGRPSMVEEDLDYWLETVGRFCPWGATVTERLD